MSPDVVEAVARRVVELLVGEDAERVLPAAGWVTVRRVARHLDVSEDWVREHAAELGAIRLGGDRGELRIPVEAVRAALERRRLEPPGQPAHRRDRRRRRRPQQHPGGFELLPIPD